MKNLEMQEIIVDKEILLKEVKRLKEYFKFKGSYICPTIPNDLPSIYKKYIKDYLWENRTRLHGDGIYFFNRQERYKILCKFEEKLKLEIREEKRLKPSKMLTDYVNTVVDIREKYEKLRFNLSGVKEVEDGKGLECRESMFKKIKGFMLRVIGKR
jgi:hypothetical protein